MADSTSTTLTEPSPQTGPSSFGSGFDAEGLPTVHEIPHHKASHEFINSTDQRSILLNRLSGSRDASINSSVGRSYNEKDMAAEAPQVPFTTPPRGARHVTPKTDASSTKLRKSDRRNTMATQYAEPTLEQGPRRGGLRNTIRRIFGRRSMKDRISMPTGPVYQRHNPEEFITSATDIETKDVQREHSASMPTSAFLRSSGLSSHPPFQPPSVPKEPDPPIPSAPRRHPPSPPQRPRRASVPSVVLNKDDMQAITEAMSGVGLQTAHDQNMDARNIGFAVTNGSNPKRRSRSAGAFRDNDHRMSPIQWRHYRNRSDEIRYLRGSTDTGVFDKAVTPEPTNPENDETIDNVLESHEGDFNFGLHAGDLQNQDRIGLEERLVTLEIKLMDFEYALSKLQPGSSLSLRRDSHSAPHLDKQTSLNSYGSSDAPAVPNGIEPSVAQPLSRSSSQKYSSSSAAMQPKDRPVSVATTLKPGHNKNNSFSKPAPELSARSSFSGLTIEHYTTLVTLIRHEQSTRVRLEEQVSQLQSQFDHLQDTLSSQMDYQTAVANSRTFSNHSYTYSNSSRQSRRHGANYSDDRRAGRFLGEKRPRSSSYSTNETDTEDDYHDAYVTPSNITPVERGEYERGAFDRVPGVEDGEAF